MIRVVQRRLIIPRGDTGTFTLPILPGTESEDVAVFSIYDPLHKEVIFQKLCTREEDAFNVVFTHEDTMDIEPSRRYEWDVKVYHAPEYDDSNSDIPIGGSAINSYYAAFNLPVCEIREFA